MGNKETVYNGDKKYIPRGTKCDICGKKLGFLATGFWSINARTLTDGVLCEECAKRMSDLIDDKKEYLRGNVLEEYAKFTLFNWDEMSLEQAKKLIVLKEESVDKKMSASGTSELFNVKAAKTIKPSAYSVGIVRAKRLNNKAVVFGVTEIGAFKKGDSVKINLPSGVIKATILEAYIKTSTTYDIYSELSAHMGKQMVPKGKAGWLVLDTESDLSKADSVIK